MKEKVIKQFEIKPNILVTIEKKNNMLVISWGKYLKKGYKEYNSIKVMNDG